MNNLTLDELVEKYTHKPITIEEHVSFYDENHRAYAIFKVCGDYIHMCLMPSIESMTEVADTDLTVKKLTFAGKTADDKRKIRELAPADFDDVFTIYMELFDKLNGESLGK